MGLLKAGQLSEIKVYESICCLSEEMLSFAKTGNWDQMIVAEERRRPLIEQLKEVSKNSPLRNEESGRKVDLIQRILSADTQTKVWVEQRMSHLQNGFKTERRLLKTYGSHALS